ncbi:MAG: hypothetical protein Q9190_001550 [Brigantiaea leucoxantha]
MASEQSKLPLRRDNQDTEVVKAQGDVLLAHELVSQIWTWEIPLFEALPRRVSRIECLEKIANSSGCRVIANSTQGHFQVKGDSEADVEKAVTKLSRFSLGAVSLCCEVCPNSFTDALESLRAQIPKQWHFNISEGEVNVFYELKLLNEFAASRAVNTKCKSDLGQVKGSSQLFAVVMTRMSTGVAACRNKMRDVTADRFASTGGVFWKDDPFQAFGDPDFPRQWREGILNASTRDQNKPNLSHLQQESRPMMIQKALSTIAEWIDGAASATQNPFEPCQPSDSTSTSTANVEEVFGTTQDLTDPRGNGASSDLARRNHRKVRKLLGNPDVKTDIELSSNLPRTSCSLADTSIGKAQHEPQLAYFTESSHDSEITNSLGKTAEGSPANDTWNALDDLSLFEKKSIRPSADNESAAPPLRAPHIPPVISSLRSSVLSPETSAQKLSWMLRNPAVLARSKRRPEGLLVDTSTPQPMSTAGNDSYHKRMPKSYLQESVQPTSEAETRILRKTNSQKKGKHITGKFDQMKAFEGATMHLLQSARLFTGVIDLKVEIGRLLIKADALPSAFSKKRAFQADDWTKIFPERADSESQTVFTDVLTSLPSDIHFISDIKLFNGQRLFSEEPHGRAVIYQLVCSTKAGDEDVIIEVDNKGGYKVWSPNIEIGSVRWLFTKRVWDARLVINATESIKEYEAAAKDIISSLSVVPSDRNSLTVAAETSNDELGFKSARVYRKLSFQCATDPDLSLSCAEVRDLGKSKERCRYIGSSSDPITMAKEGRLWWQVSLHSKQASDALQENEGLGLGEQASWLPESVVKAGVVKKLHDLAVEVVTRIDSVGQVNNNLKATSKPNTGVLPKTQGNFSEASSYW